MKKNQVDENIKCSYGIGLTDIIAIICYLGILGCFMALIVGYKIYIINTTEVERATVQAEINCANTSFTNEDLEKLIKNNSKLKELDVNVSGDSEFRHVNNNKKYFWNINRNIYADDVYFK